MPLETFERGRFYVGPNGFPRFAGSASGVYLADTIRTEVSPTSHPNLTPGIEEAFIFRTSDSEPRPEEIPFYDHYILRSNQLLPPHENAIRACIASYFSSWHPLFPFLDGGYLMQCLDNAVAMARLEEMMFGALPMEGGQAGRPGFGAGLATGTGSGAAPKKSAFDGLKAEEALVLSATFMAVVGIGDMTKPLQGDTNVLPRLRSTSQATMLAHLVVGACQNSRVNDLFAIQALLAIQLYLFATRALRPAMHLSGTTTKLVFEAGLHRCPERFPAMFPDASLRELRKRVFYSFYVLDRLLTAEFGLPIMLNDTDIDTCVPGAMEKHSETDTPPQHPARTPVTVMEEADTGGVKRKREEDEPKSAGEQSGSGVHATQVVKPPNRLLAASSLASIATMTGKAMEAFNKSVKHRSLDNQDVLSLRVDLDAWWNDMDLDSDPDEETTPSEDPRQRYQVFFTCLYHQQIINLSRPALSLSPTQLQHKHALQTAISSARTICSILSKDTAHDALGICWPGYVDMVFFASLILVYGAKREMIETSTTRTRSTTDLKRALRNLEKFAARWDNLKSFIKVLQALLDPNIPLDKPEIQPAVVDQPGTNLDELFNPDFHFDFDTFELNPESMWAYHMSIPGSPNLPNMQI